MENASKALLMAAGVLIGVLILSLAVYLFVTFGATSAELHKQNEENQVAQFNSQFTQYEGKEDVTIYDVITVANLAKENNKFYELSESGNREIKTTNYVAVNIDSIPIEKNNDNQNLINNDLEEIKKVGDELKKLPTYICTTQISDVTGRVYIINFTKNE